MAAPRAGERRRPSPSRRSSPTTPPPPRAPRRRRPHRLRPQIDWCCGCSLAAYPRPPHLPPASLSIRSIHHKMARARRRLPTGVTPDAAAAALPAADPPCSVDLHHRHSRSPLRSSSGCLQPPPTAPPAGGGQSARGQSTGSKRSDLQDPRISGLPFARAPAASSLPQPRHQRGSMPPRSGVPDVPPRRRPRGPSQPPGSSALCRARQRLLQLQRAGALEVDGNTPNPAHPR